MKDLLVKSIQNENNSEIIVDIILNCLINNITPKMIAVGWDQLKRNNLPRLGQGPGFTEAFKAAIMEANK